LGSKTLIRYPILFTQMPLRDISILAMLRQLAHPNIVHMREVVMGSKVTTD
jgi:hypothetical protein